MKKLVIVLFLCVLTFSFAGIIGCQATTQKTNLPEEKIASTPALQPAGHEDRFEEGGAAQCYGCHGAGEKANPMLNGANIMPENHYVDNSYESHVISVDRLQCISCHPVA